MDEKWSYNLAYNQTNWPDVVPLVLPVRYFDGQVCFYWFLGQLDTESDKKLRKKSKNPFFRQFPWLDMAILRPKTCPHWPEMAFPVPPKRYFDRQVCFYRLLGPPDQKNGEKVKIKSKSDFSGLVSAFQAFRVTSNC